MTRGARLCATRSPSVTLRMPYPLDSIIDFKRLLGEICDGAAREPTPSYVAVSPAAAPVLIALNEAHARGDTRTVRRIGREALALLVAKPTASR